MSKIRRYDEIMQAALANMIAKQDKVTDFNEGSVIHTILDTVSRIAEREYVAIRQGYNEMLAILPYSPFGMSKKSAKAANGTVYFSRSSALNARTVIAKGVKVTGGGLEFETTEAGAIEAGETESAGISAVCTTTGKTGNISAGVIDTIESAVAADVVAVTNKVAFTGGSDAETDTEFLARFTTYINGLSGTNTYAIKNAALSVEEVRSVSVQNHKPPYKNIYNMSIYVDDGSGSATDETIEAVRLAIEGDDTAENPGHLAPGINVRILTPTAIKVNVEMNVSVYGADLAEAKAEIESTVAEYINSLSIGETFVVSEMIKKIMNLTYTRDVLMITPTANVEPTINQIARLGAVTVSLVEAEA